MKDFLFDVSNYTEDSLRAEVSRLVASMLYQPSEVTPLTEYHDNAMASVCDHIERVGSFIDQEVFERVVRNGVHEQLRKEHNILDLVERGYYDSGLTERQLQWCLDKGYAEKLGAMMTEVQSVQEGLSLDSSKMRPMIYFTNKGSERIAWLWERICNL